MRKIIQKIKPLVKQFFQRADIFLLFLCIGCALFGTVMVYITTLGMSEAGALSNPTKFVIVQLFSMVLGIIAFVIFTVIDADLLGDQWKLLCIVNVLLLVALVIFGQDDGTGNKSWIRFAGIGIQPSEVIKVIYIVVAAKQMTYLKEYKDLNSFMSVVQMAGH
ncbi:MAG: FtsW/RodA/SpoVE family cell cycle protein, partial [Oscillospiraceae bacterium]|nr:FtsW/RodA/SpoVE family cell cycle protein [Oscillospiraceae bacterium]